jgi:hypothetical protein
VPERFQPAAGLEYGRMFDGGGYDFEILAVPIGRAADGGIVGFGGAPGENDFIDFSVEKRGDLFARPVEMLRDLAAEGMH